MSGEDGMSRAETAAAVIGSLACLGMAVRGGYCLVKCLKWCLLTTPTHTIWRPLRPPKRLLDPPKPLENHQGLIGAGAPNQGQGSGGGNGGPSGLGGPDGPDGPLGPGGLKKM